MGCLLAMLPVLVAFVIDTVLVTVVEHDCRTVAAAVGAQFLLAHYQTHAVGASDGEVQHESTVGAEGRSES